MTRHGACGGVCVDYGTPTGGRGQGIAIAPPCGQRRCRGQGAPGKPWAGRGQGAGRDPYSSLEQLRRPPDTPPRAERYDNIVSKPILGRHSPCPRPVARAGDALEPHSALVARKAVEVGPVVTRESLQVTKSPHPVESFGVEGQRHGGGEAPGATACALLGPLGVRCRVSAQKEGRKARRCVVGDGLAVGHIPLEHGQTVVVGTEATDEEVVSVEKHVLGGDGGSDPPTSAALPPSLLGHEAARLGRGHVLQHDPGGERTRVVGGGYSGLRGGRTRQVAETARRTRHRHPHVNLPQRRAVVQNPG